MNPVEEAGWQVADAMARYSVGNSLAPNVNTQPTPYIQTAANTTVTTPVYAGPPNYTGQYKRLWRIIK